MKITPLDINWDSVAPRIIDGTKTEINFKDIWRFLDQLEDDRIYTVLPLLSKNTTPDEPFIVLSQTFLITKKSDCGLICTHIKDKIDKASELYETDIDHNIFKITFKYKEVKFDYCEKTKFK